MSKSEIQNIVVIGAGKVGAHLAFAFQKAGCSIRQVVGRNEASVNELARVLNAAPLTDIYALEKGHDLYVMALPEKAMEEMLPRLDLTDELLVHTSGSLPMDILFPFAKNSGVFYPLQTFTQGRELVFDDIPILLEANQIDNEKRLMDLALKLSTRVQHADSAQRKALHLSAVFACNFSNHMYELARQLLNDQGLDFQLLIPLIRETAGKATSLGPENSQTGPAVRGDLKTMLEHLEMLNDKPAIKDLYKRISDNISEQQEHRDDKL